MEELTEKAKSKDIISVAENLGIKLTRTGQSFKGEWAGHDSFPSIHVKILLIGTDGAYTVILLIS